jgi:hypothetical protein
MQATPAVHISDTLPGRSRLQPAHTAAQASSRPAPAAGR